MTLPHRHHVLSASSHHIPIKISAELLGNETQHLSLSQRDSHPPQKWGTISHGTSQQTLLALTNENNNIAKFIVPSHPVSSDSLQPLGLIPPSGKDSGGGGTSSGGGGKDKELPTPTSTPTTSRKIRRRSNLFIPSSSKKEQQDKIKNGELGSGRAIPIKQGYLYKRSSKSLNKEWKKKYVTLCDDGRLTYHPSLHDYMDDVHGKEVSLQYVTVKVPGQKPRGSKSIITNSALTGANAAPAMNGKMTGSTGSQGSNGNGLTEGIGGLSLAKDRKLTEKVLLTAFDTLREPVKSNSQTSGDEGIVISNSNSQSFLGSDGNTSKLDAQTPNVKKRHRRMKSSGVGKNNEYDGRFSSKHTRVLSSTKITNLSNQRRFRRVRVLHRIAGQQAVALRGVQLGGTGRVGVGDRAGDFQIPPGDRIVQIETAESERHCLDAVHSEPGAGQWVLRGLRFAE